MGDFTMSEGETIGGCEVEGDETRVFSTKGLEGSTLLSAIYDFFDQGV
jgi:hypothetical protein